MIAELPAVAPDIVIAARVFGALLFATAAWGKIRHFDEFAGIVGQYRLLPPALVTPAAFLVVLAEVLAAAGLMVALLAPLAALLGIALLLLFSAAIGVNLARGETAIECGCFRTALRQPLSGWLLLRNALCLIPFALAAFPPEAPIGVLHYLAGGAAGLSCLALMMAFNMVLSLREQADQFRRRYAR